MRNLNIDTKGDSIVLTLNRKGFDRDYIISLVRRLKLEELAKRSGFTEDVKDIADELDKGWWDDNGEQFLKDVRK
jgi:hypothetical protein